MAKSRMKPPRRMELREYCCTEACKFSDPNDRYGLELQRYNLNRTNFVPIGTSKSGWLSPTGVFFPCPGASHERLREFLTVMFKVGEGSDWTARTKLFEQTWVKVHNTNNTTMAKDIGVRFAGEVLTAYQKLWLSEWHRRHLKRVLEKNGGICINYKFWIDSNYNIKIRKDDDNEETAKNATRPIRRISAGD